MEGAIDVLCPEKSPRLSQPLVSSAALSLSPSRSEWEAEMAA